MLVFLTLLALATISLFVYSTRMFLSICTATILVKPLPLRAHVCGMSLLFFIPGFNFWNHARLSSWSCVFISLHSLPWRTSQWEYSIFWFQPYISVSLFKYSALNITCQHSMELANLDSILASVLPGLHKLCLSTSENAVSLGRWTSLQEAFAPSQLMVILSFFPSVFPDACSQQLCLF